LTTLFAFAARFAVLRAMPRSLPPWI